MIVWIYKNGMCDPKAKLGGIKKFNKSSDVDSFLKTMCHAMSPFGHSQIQVFITNDDVPQEHVDHKVLMGDNIGLDTRDSGIKEVDTVEIAAQTNQKMSTILDARGRRMKMERDLNVG